MFSYNIITGVNELGETGIYTTVDYVTFSFDDLMESGINECISTVKKQATLHDFLKNLHGTIKVSDLPDPGASKTDDDIIIQMIHRKNDRKYLARHFTLPIYKVIECENLDKANALARTSEKQVVVIENTYSGYAYCYAKVGSIPMYRLFALKHEIQDGTLPFYYLKSGETTYDLNPRYNMFWSDYHQVDVFKNNPHFYDKCCHIEQVYVAQSADINNLI